MSRRTVDITVDAYDAPMLAALAKLRAAHRERGLADGEWHMFREGWTVAFRGVSLDAKALKRLRTQQERDRAHDAYIDANLIVAGEVAELFESDSPGTHLEELIDVAGACLRQASRLTVPSQTTGTIERLLRDIDAKGKRDDARDGERDIDAKGGE